MANDDYHVIVYQILAYLYTTLKEGIPVDPSMLEFQSKYLGINQKYWQYIMENLLNDGYITGITITKAWGNEKIVSGLENCQITPRGIEYVTDDRFMKKAVRFLKDVKSIVPFV